MFTTWDGLPDTHTSQSSSTDDRFTSEKNKPAGKAEKLRDTKDDRIGKERSQVKQQAGMVDCRRLTNIRWPSSSRGTFPRGAQLERLQWERFKNAINLAQLGRAKRTEAKLARGHRRGQHRLQPTRQGQQHAAHKEVKIVALGHYSVAVHVTLQLILRRKGQMQFVHCLGLSAGRLGAWGAFRDFHSAAWHTTRPLSVASGLSQSMRSVLMRQFDGAFGVCRAAAPPGYCCVHIVASR